MSKSKYDFHRNFAVIIGINNYSNGIPELETPVADAEELAKILQENYQYEVQILLNEKAKLQELNSLLDSFKQNTLNLPYEFVQLEKNDRLIFYFAGHGIVPADGLENTDNLGGYLVPQDARGDILLQKQIEINKILLPMQDLHDALTELPCRHLLIILDCCFAGAFRSSLYREIVPARKVYEQRYDRFIRDPAWQAIASAAHDQKAIDYLGCFGERGTIEDNKHSPFAEALFEGLRGAADTTPREGDSIITATELYCYVRDRVEVLTDEQNRRQTPGLFPLKKHDKGEYIFLLPNFDQDKLEDAPALNEENNPYRGLKSYEEEHSPLFFGRDELVKQLYDRVCKPENLLTVVLGVSGSGKSSLVKAGLIPYLRTNDHELLHIIPTLRPGESPFAALAEAIVENSETSRSKIDAIKSLSKTLKQAPRQFIDVIANWRQIPANTRLLLVIDQFEELITTCKQQEREQFLNFLGEALAAHSQQLYLVLTLRSDFEPRFLDSALKAYWINARFPVRAMRGDELRQAIERPALEKMLDFEPPELVSYLIDEVGQMPGALSLLSFTLSELYIKCIESDRGNRSLTKADYKNLGGVAGSLTHRATEVYNKLDKAQQITIQQVMLRMVTVEGGESARRRVSLSELVYSEDAENKRVKEVIKRFDEARLIVGGRETGGEPYVEPAHDALVRGWNKLQEWKNEEQENLLLQQRLTPAANDWHINNRPLGLLLPDGDRLNQLEKILNQENNWFNQREIEFVQASINYRNIQQRQAREQQTRTELLRKVDRVEDLLPVQPLEGLILAIQAMGQNLEVTSVAISRDGKIIVSASFDGTLRLWNRKGNPIGRPLRGHKWRVLSVAFSPDGEIILSGGVDGTVRLWDRRNHLSSNPFRFREDDPFKDYYNQVTSVAISTDGKTIVSGYSLESVNSEIAGTVRLWDLQGNYLGLPFQGHEDEVTSVTISPDGKTIISGSWDETIRLWDLQGNPIGQPFRGHEEGVTSVAISPDGKTIVSGSADQTVRLWDLQGNPIGQPFLHDDRVNVVTISSDAQTIISGSGLDRSINSSPDWTVRLWNLQGNLIAEPFRGHENGVTSLAVSPDGQTIISGSDDGTIRLWDLQGNSIRRFFKGNVFAVTSVAISPDGRTIISGSTDNTIQLWDWQGNPIGPPFLHEDGVISIAYGSDGHTIVSGSRDGTVRLWRGHWKSWLEVCCNRLRYHPVFKNPQTEVEKQAWETCQNYVWEPEKGAQKLYDEQARKRIEEENLQAAEERNFSAAISILSLVIQLNPDHAGAYYHRGKCYAESNNQQKTTEDFKEAATLYQQQGKTETEEYQEVMQFLNRFKS